MIFQCLYHGLERVWANKRMLVPFYLVNLVCGLFIMLPFAYALDDFVGKSGMREHVGGAMDYNFFFEFLYYADSGLASVTGMIVAVPIVYWLITIFLSGGALMVFAGGEKYSPSRFWGGAAAFFGRFVRLTLMAIPVAAALFCLRYLVSLVQWIFFGSDPYEYIIYWGAWVKMAVGFVALLLFGLIFDYARIHLVLTENRKVRKSLWRGTRFAAANLRSTFGLAFVIFLTGWAAVVAYYFTSDIFSAPNWFIVVSLLVWQQLYILFRMALRLTVYSSQTEMYRQLSR